MYNLSVMAFLNVSLFLIIAYCLGFLLIKPIEKYLGLITKTTIPLLLGSVILSYFIFLSAFFLEFSRTKTVLITLLAGLPTCFLILRKRNAGFKIKPRTIFEKFKRKVGENLFVVVALTSLFLFFAKIWSKMLVMENGSLFAGWVGIWGDWAAHSSYISSFAYGSNFPPELPILAGYPFSYTFFPDFISAIFVKLGASLIQAVLIPSFLLSVAFCLIFFDCARIILKNKSQAIIALLVFLFNGGLGFYYFFKDVSKGGFSETLARLPREYTHLEPANIQVINHLTSKLIPQRSFLLGLPLAVFALFLLWRYSSKKDPKLLLVTALVGAALPLIHLHSFLVLAIAALFVFVTTFSKKRLKFWILPALLVLFFALPQMIAFSPRAGLDFLKWRPGWMAYKTNDNIVWFWFKNVGFSLVLIPLGFLTAGKKLRLASLPFFLIFISANLFLFQPYEYDNTKLFTYWLLQSSLLIALGLSFFWKRNLLGKAVAVLLFWSVILSGFLDVFGLLQYERQKIHFLSERQITAAEWVRENTPPEAVFLTADNHNHPVTMLTGRKILLGYKGWIWTYGIDYSRRETSLRNLARNPSFQALKDLHIDFVFFSDLERRSFLGSLEPWLERNLVEVYREEDISVYRVSN